MSMVQIGPKARLVRTDRELLECAYLRYPTRNDKTR